jgi:hypothetical protein
MVTLYLCPIYRTESVRKAQSSMKVTTYKNPPFALSSSAENHKNQVRKQCDRS